MIIPLPSPTPPTPAESSAIAILSHINSAAAQAVERQRLLYAMFWDDRTSTPDEKLIAMREQSAGSDMRFLLAASESASHLTTLAEIAGVTLPALIDMAYVIPRRDFVIANGVVSLAPPAEGFDAWGVVIPPIEPEP